jgi:hypothetical protein
MIAEVSGTSGIPQVIALVVVALIFATILFWSVRSKSHNKS